MSFFVSIGLQYRDSISLLQQSGKRFCVVGVEGERLLLADGKTRQLAAPKRKQLGHVTILSKGLFAHPVIQKMHSGQTVSDREIRRMLAAFRDEMEV